MSPDYRSPSDAGRRHRAMRYHHTSRVQPSLLVHVTMFLSLAGLVAITGCSAVRSGGSPGASSTESRPIVPPRTSATVHSDTYGSEPAWPLGQRGVATHGMVTAAHPLASEAGIEMLRRGGNAVDAAVAAGFVIGVVEPMMSGIGGSGSMLIWDADRGRAEYLDFYASAPAGAYPGMDIRKHPARLVAVPGAVKGLLEAHERFGVLSREEVMAPAIRLAREGFPVSPLLARTIADDSIKLTRPGRAQEIFWPDMRPLRAGELLVQPELAATLERISHQGARGFYEGPVADEIVRVLAEGENPITTDDLVDYEPIWRRPVCGTFRGHVVLSSPPPQGGMQVVETLHLLDRSNLADEGWPVTEVAAFHTLASALRIGIADRQTFLGDPERSAIPAAGLTSPEYANERMIPAVVPDRVTAGDPWDEDALPPSEACAPFDPVGPASGPRSAAGSAGSDTRGGETTHLSVVDSHGNAVALTLTQGAYFGSGIWAAGTFLNNAMSIFSSADKGPNQIRPGARPTSTTTPTILLRDGEVQMVVGSPGGGRIPPAVVQSIVYVLEYGLDPLDALRMPRMQPQASTRKVELEQGFTGAVLGEANAMDYEIEVYPPLSLYFGGVHLIVRRDGQWIGAADPRRDGQVRGY